MRLRVEANRLALGAHLREEPKRRVATVGKQLAQLRRVGKRDIDVGQNAVAQLLVEHGPGDFHALVHVARHEVGARQVYFHVRARSEAVDAAMLEHASHDRDDAHVLGVAFHAWDQTRYAANEHDRLHARLRCLRDLVDDLFVGDRVRLEEQPARLASPRKLDLVVDVLQDERFHLQGCYPQHIVVVRHVLKRHVAEELRRIAADRGARRDERQVGVELGRLLVVIARAELRDVLDTVVGLAGDAADLAVHLVIAEAVDDVASGLLEALRPFDIVALVEARAQLEQRGDLLAVLGGVDERFGEVRLACQAVERDFDRDDARVARRLA